MARHNLAESAEHEATVTETFKRPETVGDLLPGLAAFISGVNVHALPIGVLDTLIGDAIAQQIQRKESSAASGISATDDTEEHKAAKLLGKGAALEAFGIGILPMDLEAEEDYVQRAAVNYIRATIESHAAKSGNAEKSLSEWFDKRFTETEREALARPRNQSRVNCLKRVAREYIAKPDDALNEAALTARGKVVAEGKKAHSAALESAKSKVQAAGVRLLDPLAEPVVSVSADADEEVGF